MGIKFTGPVCVECHTPVESPDYFHCPRCNRIVHNNDHCMTIHRSKGRGAPDRTDFDPDVPRRPDVRDIIK